MLSTIRMTWGESFRFFLTPEFRLYFLLIGNTVMRTIKLLARYFFWLIPLLYLFDLTKYSAKTNIIDLTALVKTNITSIQAFAALMVALFAYSLFFNLLILCTRASLEPKGPFYFLYYLPIIVFFTFCFNIIPSTTGLFLNDFFFAFGFYFNIFFQLSLFFFLDATFSIKNVFLSSLKAVKMLLYFLPFFIVYVGIVMGFINILSLIAEKSFAHLIPYTLISPIVISKRIFSDLFLVSTLSVLYISLKHRYYKLFFTS